MSITEVYPTLVDIFREELRSPVLLIEPSMTHDDIPGWDSAATVAIIMSVEERFDLELSASDLKGLFTVGDFVEMIQRHIK